MRSVGRKVSRFVGGDGEATGFRGEMIDRIGGAGEGDGRNAEVLLVPKVHAGFVANFDLDSQVLEQLACPENDRVFCLVGRIFVEVEQVVVSDASLGCLPSNTFHTVWNNAPAVSHQSETPRSGAS